MKFSSISIFTLLILLTICLTTHTRAGRNTPESIDNEEERNIPHESRKPHIPSKAEEAAHTDSTAVTNVSTQKEILDSEQEELDPVIKLPIENTLHIIDFLEEGQDLINIYLTSKFWAQKIVKWLWSDQSFYFLKDLEDQFRKAKKLPSGNATRTFYFLSRVAENEMIKARALYLLGIFPWPDNKVTRNGDHYLGIHPWPENSRIPKGYSCEYQARKNFLEQSHDFLNKKRSESSLDKDETYLFDKVNIELTRLSLLQQDLWVPSPTDVFSSSSLIPLSKRLAVVYSSIEHVDDLQEKVQAYDRASQYLVNVSDGILFSPYAQFILSASFQKLRGEKILNKDIKVKILDISKNLATKAKSLEIPLSTLLPSSSSDIHNEWIIASYSKDSEQFIERHLDSIGPMEDILRF